MLLVPFTAGAMINSTANKMLSSLFVDAFYNTFSDPVAHTDGYIVIWDSSPIS